MTGPEHYREAERLMGMCVDGQDNPPSSPAPELDAYLQLAQVHATLALAAATALSGRAAEDSPDGMYHADFRAWDAVAGVQQFPGGAS